jgi:hypothetical protein
MDITLTDTEKAHSARLSTEIALEVASHWGFLPFSRYMEMALYQPGSGYYSAGAHKLGSGGDFTTAPEISPFFGMALTNAIMPVLEGFRSRGKPTRILEFGAGTGKLAASILHRLKELNFSFRPLWHSRNRPRFSAASAYLVRRNKKRSAVLNRNRLAQRPSK